jgi:membrane glycosyltransferase
MELHINSRLNNGQAADVCRRYLDKLPVAPELRRQLLAEVRHIADPSEALAHLHQAMINSDMQNENPAYASIRQRLELAYEDLRGQTEIIGKDRAGRARIANMPPVNRSSMTPKPWPLNPFKGALHTIKSRVIPTTAGFLGFKRTRHTDSSESPDPRGHWHNTGTYRRIALLGLVIAQTALATYFMKSVLPYHGSQPLEMAILFLFTILTAWVSAGFWTAMTGFFILRFGGDRYDISASSVGDTPIDAKARTAIIMPIRNENVPRVFAGLRATYESLAQAGELEHFDFYILSDSNDPDARVAEEAAWLDLCRAVGGFGRVFYRWRQHQIKRKSGNVADFCRRWGNNYRYMVVLDADSVMSGECLAKLVRLMEANPNAGIIQTAPRAAGRETFYARLQQFASSVYGPLFIAGLHFWQLGESHYWGHNAIIRVAPFVQHCALGRLPGTGSLSGDILSHDFVEAALMRRAGWAVWIAYDLPGSYEEMPPNLVDELQRDRRWCQGNLMNFRLFMAPGMHPAHRAVFITGVIAYVSAPLWLLFLALSTWLLAAHTLVEPQYFSGPKQLFPLWPEWHPERALALFGATTTLLFLPKILSVVHIWLNGAKRFGGLISLIMSMLVELLVSMLLAPIRMLFHTQFVIAALTGWSIQWKSPPREDTATPWKEAFKRHGTHTLLGLAWAGGVYWLNPSFLWWLLPVVGALILSIPISVYSSRVSLGRFMRKFSFFIIPEEAHPPQELRWVQNNIRLSQDQHGFIDAVTDPITNALVCMFGIARPRQTKTISNYRLRLAHVALQQGPTALSDKQKMILLSDPSALSYLHFNVWTSNQVHQDWFPAKPEHEVVPAREVGRVSTVSVLAS